MADLLGGAEGGDGPVELHHSTLHVKPPETGHPFPMHQDWALLPTSTPMTVMWTPVLVHLDDTSGTRTARSAFSPGHTSSACSTMSSKTPETGKGCTPHLPTDRFRLEDTVPVPARAGDVVVFKKYSHHSR